MKLKLIIASLCFLSSFPAFAENDKEGCKNHPLLTNKISGYYIYDCPNNDYGQETILNEKGEEKIVSGKKTVLIYQYVGHKLYMNSPNGSKLIEVIRD